MLFTCLNDNSELPVLPGSEEPDQDIGVADSDGQNPRFLKPAVRIFGEPSWLANGKTVAFGNVRHDNQGHKTFVSDRSVYTMTIDGAGPAQAILQGVSEAAWSPDGRRVAYVTSRKKENPVIYVANADCSDEHLLTEPKIRVSSLAWSPDSTRIAFARWHGSRSTIGVTNLQDGQFAELTPRNLNAFGPNWSQDGRRIAFSAIRSEGTQVFLINADGTGVRQLSNEKEKDCEHPSWSPDGSQIVFECHSRMVYGPSLMSVPSLLWPLRTMLPAGQIYLINVNASNALPIQLTHAGGNNPRFCPAPGSSRAVVGN